MKKTLLFFVFCFWFIFLSAATLDDGWQLLKRNDFINARKAFSEVLNRDSANAEALKGMIVLSDIMGDELMYRKYLNTYMNNISDENFYQIFNSFYSGSPEKILSNKQYSEKAKIDAYLEKATEFFDKRDYSKYRLECQKVLNNLNWCLTGPFENIEGSGFIVDYPVEQKVFNSNEVFTDKDGISIPWVKYVVKSNRGQIYFDDYLNGKNGYSVYYANTFIQVPTSRTVQLRMARTAPMKIWVDDQLVFSNPDKVAYAFDNEIIEVNLSAGTHRLLIKNASAPKRTATSNYYFADSYQDKFAIRITDTHGILFSDIQSEYEGDYIKSEIKASIKNESQLDFYLSKTKSNPDDWFSFYAYSIASQTDYQALQAESQVLKWHRSNPDAAFFKYLAYEIYSINGKKEKGYEVMTHLDLKQTPVFDLLYEKLGEIDLDNEPEKYFDAVSNLLKVAPSNKKVILALIMYFKKRNLRPERTEFVKAMIEEYPQYKDDLEDELEEETDKPYKEITLSEKKRKAKDAEKRLKTVFETDDFEILIDYYKSVDNKKKVIALYDELITAMPYEISYRKDKADFFFSDDKFEEALSELNKALLVKQNDDETLETIGDIYQEKKEIEKAKYYYSLALKYCNDNYMRGDLKDKLSKLMDPISLKKLFTTKSFSDILYEDNWSQKYRGEESVVLMYTSDMLVDSNQEYTMFNQFMVKILSEAGSKKWTEYDFSFLGRIQSAKVIKLNGTVMNPEMRSGYVVFKNLESGDLIQIEGKTSGDAKSEFGNEFFLFKSLAFESPCYYAKIEVGMMAGKYLGYQMHYLADNLSKVSRDGFDFYKWEFNHLPKLVDEDATIDRSDKFANIMFSTLPDWSEVVSWYQKKTYRKLEASYELQEVLDSVIRPGMSDEQKVQSLYSYLTRKISYSFVPFLQSGYIPNHPGRTLAGSIGDCKDVATVMIALLRMLGFESYYVLVKTNDYFQQRILPSTYFNHAIAAVKLNGSWKYLDLTTDFYPWYVITRSDANAWSLLVKDGETQLFRLPDDYNDIEKNKVEYFIKAQINTDRSVQINSEVLYPGISGGSLREILSTLADAERKRFIMESMGRGVFQDLKLIEMTILNLDEINEPLKISYKLIGTNFGDRIASLLAFRMPYLCGIEPSSALSEDTRRYSLSIQSLMVSRPTVQHLEITFPTDYVLIELPVDVSKSSTFGAYSVRYTNTTNGIKAEKIQYFNKSIIEPADFKSFKEFYLSLLDLDATKVAILPKTRFNSIR